ncbi:MAG: class I SAM-dependent methyltransferase [Ruminococcus sp.]
MIINTIDNGNSFDFGRTSDDYAKYRDIYPPEFYERILERGLCKNNQKILDIGTGTGVLPRNMYKYGGKWVATDISENQIKQAKRLADEAHMDIEFYVCSAEDIIYPANSFDVITACQCIWYPNHKKTAPNFAKILKSGGKFLILYMAWLPFEDEIAGRSEEIILRYNPQWTGAGETRKHVWIPDEYLSFFDITLQEEFDVKVSFTRESWHGRMRACRGVAASMSEDILKLWDSEHKKMLKETAPENFDVLHYVSIAELTLR